MATCVQPNMPETQQPALPDTDPREAAAAAKLRKVYSDFNVVSVTQPTEGEPHYPEKQLVKRFRHVYAGRGGWYGHKNGQSRSMSLMKTTFFSPRHRKELLKQAADITQDKTEGAGIGENDAPIKDSRTASKSSLRTSATGKGGAHRAGEPSTRTVKKTVRANVKSSGNIRNHTRRVSVTSDRDSRPTVNASRRLSESDQRVDPLNSSESDRNVKPTKSTESVIKVNPSKLPESEQKPNPSRLSETDKKVNPSRLSESDQEVQDSGLSVSYQKDNPSGLLDSDQRANPLKLSESDLKVNTPLKSVSARDSGVPTEDKYEGKGQSEVLITVEADGLEENDQQHDESIQTRNPGSGINNTTSMEIQDTHKGSSASVSKTAKVEKLPVNENLHPHSSSNKRNDLEPLKTFRSCPSRLNQLGQLRTTSEYQTTHHKRPNYSLRSQPQKSKEPKVYSSEKDKRSSRKNQLFSRLSQEAQLAISETISEMKKRKTREPTFYKKQKQTNQAVSPCFEEREEKESNKVNEELNKFAQKLSLGPAVEDNSDSESSGNNKQGKRLVTSSGRKEGAATRPFSAYQTSSMVCDYDSAQLKRPRTRLPVIGAGSRFYHPHDNGQNPIVGERGRYRIVSLAALAKENTFEITPPGYDSRYNVPRRDLDVEDDTPEDIRAKAIEKCNEWLHRYV